MNYSAKTHGHESDDTKLQDEVYRGSFSCVMGSEELVISSLGKLRPCHLLPENLFSVPSENALYEHIHGDFHKDFFKNVWNEYSNMRKNNINKFCRGIT